MPSAFMLVSPLRSLTFAGVVLAAHAASSLALATGDANGTSMSALRETAVRRLNMPATMLPAGVPTPADRERRLRERGFEAGDAVFIRIFKAESELELWMKRDGVFERFATYPICYWSGKLGPKQREGDRQAPEGIYSVSAAQLHRHGRWPRALDIGFPNALDRAQKRTGSAILVHGGCSSIGCYAMTNPVMEEIFTLAEQAIEGGQDAIPIHVFPFRMTPANIAAQQHQPWSDFWQNLKEAYDSFERVRLPPHVSICSARYLVRDGDQDAAAPVVPRRMLRLVRMMRGELPIQRGECTEEPPPTPEVIASANRLAHGLNAATVPAPAPAAARMLVPPVPVRVYRNARLNYAAARRARVEASNRRYSAVRTR